MRSSSTNKHGAKLRAALKVDVEAPPPSAVERIALLEEQKVQLEAQAEALAVERDHAVDRFARAGLPSQHVET